MHTKLFSAGRSVGAVLLVLALAMTLTACGKKRIGPGPARPEVREVSTSRLLREADDAWQDREWAKSELFYERLLTRADLDTTDVQVVQARFTTSTLKAGHYHRTILASEAWARAVPSVRQKWAPWYRVRLAAYQALRDGAGARLFLTQVARNESLPMEIREQAVDSLFTEEEIGRDDEAVFADFLERFQSVLPDGPFKARLDAGALDWLASLSDSSLEAIRTSGGREKQDVFPYSLAAFEQAWRTADDDAAEWPAAYRVMRRSMVRGGIFDVTPLRDRLKVLEERYGLPKAGIALALPLSGRFGPIGWKILKGAGIAQWRLLQNGMELEVRVMNTDSPDWIDELAALPPSFALAGGPVRKEALAELDESGLLRERAFFTFMPSLGERTEGRDAWRFFGSPQDQVRSLVRLAVDRMDIRNFAIVYPEESFGRRMSEIFWKEAEALGGKVTGMASYPPKDPTKWGDRISGLLEVPPKRATEPSLKRLLAMDNSTDYSGRPKPDFQAVFLPDGWAQASILAPQFFFFEEDRLLLLGPALWSQALTSQSRSDTAQVEDTYFRLGVCPGAWWPENPSPGMKALRASMDEAGLGEPDFWIALGFDFVRFASRIGQVPKGADAEKLNAKLAAASQMDWSLAPMTWDEEGRASQWYYLFQPHSKGLRVIDPERLRRSADRMQRLHRQRESIRRQKRIDELTGSSSDKR